MASPDDPSDDDPRDRRPRDGKARTRGDARVIWLDLHPREAGDCASGIAAAEHLKPDIGLLDIELPGIDGLACLELLKALPQPMAVIMVTLHSDRHYVLDAIRRGAAGYLLKDATTTEVVAVLRSVADGHLSIDPQLLREALNEPHPPPRAKGTVLDRVRALAITPREHQVLLGVADGLTNKEIGARLGISDDTVKKHVQNLIWKLRAADRTQAAVICAANEPARSQRRGIRDRGKLLKAARNRPIPPAVMSDYDVTRIRQAGTTVPGLLVPVRTDRPRLPDTIGARRSADVRIDGLNGAGYVHVVFSVDDATNEVRIAMFDDAGQLVRIIPPKSVTEMLTTMAQYAGI